MPDSLNNLQTWNEKKARLKTKFGLLVDSDLNFSEENKDKMFSRLNEKLGHTRSELEAFMNISI